MKQTIKKIRDKAIKSKIYMARMISYMSLINFTMLLLNLLLTLQFTGRIGSVKTYFIVLFIVVFISLTVLGWFEVNYLKGMDEENRVFYNHVPQMNEILERLKRIERKGYKMEDI